MTNKNRDYTANGRDGSFRPFGVCRLVRCSYYNKFVSESIYVYMLDTASILKFNKRGE